MIKRYIFKLLFYVIVFVLVLFSLRGAYGNINSSNINHDSWKEDGPFELSPERGRFALTYSLVEDKSFQFDLPVARFALPDLGYFKGKYVSLFAPGVSFLIIPGYFLGKLFGLAQVGSFLIISFFALSNVILIRSIAKKLGAKDYHTMIAALAFLFATPAYTYAVSLYQHHVSVFLLLAGVWVYMNYNSALSTWVIWFLVALSVSIDYPNLFMMMPLTLLALFRIIKVRHLKGFVQIKFKFFNLLSISGIIMPFLFFGWVNLRSYGDIFRLAGTVENVREIDDRGYPVRKLPKDATQLEEYRAGERDSNSVALGFFNSRNISNGLFIHFLSPDRGIVFFAPVVLFSIVGAFVLYKKNSKTLGLFCAISLINIFTYSMWGDPWGGWAFGSRYLIPFYAIACILLAVSMDKIYKSKLLRIFLFAVLMYSVSVNVLGALTSSRNPPKIEVLALEKLSGKEEKFTYERNWDYLRTQGTKSFIYNRYLKDYLRPTEYYFLVVSIISIFITFVFLHDFILNKFIGLSAPNIIGNSKIKNVLISQNGFRPSSLRIKLKMLINSLVLSWNRRTPVWKNR